MLAAGDELGHSQGGNNNPYCQDNPITWIDWSQADHDLLRLHRPGAALRRRRLPLAPLVHRPARRPRAPTWPGWRRTGEPLTPALEQPHVARAGAPGSAPRAHAGTPLLLLFNARDTDADFLLPAGAGSRARQRRAATVAATGTVDGGQRSCRCAPAAWCCWPRHAAHTPR
jgi:glycogen operon protein